MVEPTSRKLRMLGKGVEGTRSIVWRVGWSLEVCMGCFVGQLSRRSHNKRAVGRLVKAHIPQSYSVESRITLGHWKARTR